MTTFEKRDFMLKVPSNIVCSGPSSSGKTSFILNLLRNINHLFDPVPQSILYCYGEFNHTITMLENAGIKTLARLPTEEDFSIENKPLLVVLDDCMPNVSQEYLEQLFTRQSHHQNLCVVLLTQNLFDKKIKTARTNAHYLILMRSPSAALQVRTIGTHLFPQKLSYFLKSYEMATKSKYGYMLVDQHPSSPDQLRLRTNIFPPDDLVVFLPK